jgi:prevent-host-death family protein
MANRGIKLGAHESVPLADLEAGAAKLVARARAAGKPVVVTDDGEPTAVVLTPEQFEELGYRRAFIAAVEEGLADEAAGRTLTTDEVKAHLENKFGPIRWT